MTVKSFRPEVLIQGNWKASDRRFATYSEAKSAAQDLYTRQILCEGFRAEPCDDPITHAWVGDSKRTPARTQNDTLENPCTQCGGDGWEEEPSHFAQGRCDGDIIYRKVDCDRCGGSGEEPPPACECGDEEAA